MDDDEKPRRRRRAAAAVAAEPERGLILRVLLHSPKDTLAVTAALAAVAAIVTNAMFLQAGRHPSPMFSTATVSEMPAAAPVPGAAAAGSPAEAEGARHRQASGAGNRTGEAGSRNATAASGFACRKERSRRRSDRFHAPDRGGPARADRVWLMASSSRPVLSVPTHKPRSRKFERDRKMPVTGQLSDRLIRDLTVLTGRPIE